MNGGFESFDYALMAEEALARVHNLEAGIAKLKAKPVRGMRETLQRYAGLQLLEDELLEQKALYRLFRQRAQDRGQIPGEEK